MFSFISISGPDGVGKTSTINEIHKVTNFRYMIYDRDIPDQVCYTIIGNRNDCIDPEYYLNFMYRNKEQLYVILNSNLQTITNRMNQRKDWFTPIGTTLNEAINYFKRYEDDTADNVLYIDNSDKTIDQVVDIILNKMQYVKK